MKAQVIEEYLEKLKIWNEGETYRTSEILLTFPFDGSCITAAHSGCKRCLNFAEDLRRLLKWNECDGSNTAVGVTFSQSLSETRMSVQIEGDFLHEVSKLGSFYQDIWFKLSLQTADFQEHFSSKIWPTPKNTAYKTKMFYPNSWNDFWGDNKETMETLGYIQLLVGTE